MISPETFFTPIDPEKRRRQALASVYDLLLKLAREKNDLEKFLASNKEPENQTVPLQKNIPPDV